MRTINHLYTDDASFFSFLKDIEVPGRSEVLVRVHSSIHSKDEIRAITDKIPGLLPGAHIIGCSTSQVILDGTIRDHSCLISVSVFEKASITSLQIPCKRKSGDWREGQDVAKELLSAISDPRPGLMLAFFPNGYGKISAFMDIINASSLPIQMIGGVACILDGSTGAPEGTTYVVGNNISESTDVSVAYITSSDIHIYSDYSCGVEPVGKKSRITSHGNIIDEVDRIPAAKWYASLLNEDALSKDPSIAKFFPLVACDGREIAYYVSYSPSDAKHKNHNKDYVLQSFGELVSGERFSPGYFHPQKIFNQLTDLIASLNNKPSEAIFAYSCETRMALLSGCATWEISHFRNTNLSGCLVGGEIASRGGENFYANYTFVTSTVSENPETRFIIDTPDPSCIQNLQEENMHLLNLLLTNANKHLSEELSDQQAKMQDAVFYNAAIDIDNQLKYLFDKDKEGLDKAAILALNNEKMLRLFSGITETYGFLKDCYQKVQRKFKNSGIYMYSYNDTSLLVASTGEISENAFEKLIDRIQSFLNGTVYEDIPFSYTAVTIIGNEDNLNRLETALNYARNHKLTRARYSDIVSDLKKDQENVHMLWVLREALLHRRVFPYFQEIHDNAGGEKRMFESLMRIKDADGKVYFPDSFLPVAKEYDLYDSLSELMVRTVIEFFWDKNARVTINLNVQDIYNRNMLNMIFTNMKRTPNPGNYVFEIVESEEVTDYEYIKNFADRIHEYGAKIAIDDFGSGFSSLLHLFSISADYIKIDGAIIRTIVSDPLCRDFIEFMNTWCHKAGQELICEYVENEEIQNIMLKMGVRFSQGYYFSKPHPWDDELDG